MPKKIKYILVKCPLCLGDGKIKKRLGSSYSYSVEQIGLARKLYRKGYSLREIAKKMGINHPQTIANLIRRKTI